MQKKNNAEAKKELPVCCFFARQWCQKLCTYVYCFVMSEHVWSIYEILINFLDFPRHMPCHTLSTYVFYSIKWHTFYLFIFGFNKDLFWHNRTTQNVQLLIRTFSFYLILLLCGIRICWNILRANVRTWTQTFIDCNW